MTLFLLICLPFSLVQAQTVKVNGRVTDDLNEPMIGVSIVEKGTANGCITDIDGNYTLNVKQGATLVYSYIGYVALERKAVAGVMNIILKEDSQALDEVVVVGYGVQKEKFSDGCHLAGEVRGYPESFYNPCRRSLTRQDGRGTAGVYYFSAGSSPTIRIRGFSSNGTSDPLYVVDGLIVNDLSSIDLIISRVWRY